MEALLQKYALQDEWDPEKSTDEWKEAVYAAVTEHSFQILREECRSKTKTSHLIYDLFTTQKYIYNCPTHISSFVFRVRSHTLNCRDNQHSSHEDLTCRLCGQDVETQLHVINCPNVRRDGEFLSLDSIYNLDFEDDDPTIQVMQNRYQEFVRLVAE